MKKVANRFFAKFVAGGLILRLLMVNCALAFAFAGTLAGLTIAGVPVDWVSHAIAFGLMSVALCAAHFVDCIRVDPDFASVRLLAATAIRVGIPLAGIVILDRFMRPGFLASTLVFWLVGFSIGLLTSLTLTVAGYRASHKRKSVAIAQSSSTKP
jgi:hypothetical protein